MVILGKIIIVYLILYILPLVARLLNSPLDESETLHATAESAYNLPQSTLSEDGWQLSAPEIRALMDKLKSSGVPLGKYVDGKFYRGITTGLNEAFVIDETKRAQLIAADPKSAELIKPYLRGRNVKRWQIDYQKLYIIFTRRGIDIDEYSAIKAHLEQYRERLTPGITGGRKPGSYEWFEIQDNIAYYGEFEKPKIVFPDIASKTEFAYDTNNSFLGNTAYIIPVDDLYPLSILNSNVVLFFYNQISPTIRGGYYRFISQYMEQIPIPNATDDLRQQIASLAQQCLDAAKDNPDKLPALEAELNQLVYQAYGLDEDDIRVIEGHLSGAAVASGDADDLDGDEE